MLDVVPEVTVDSQPTPQVAETPAQENTAGAEVKTEVDAKPAEPDHATETKKALKGVQKRIDELTRARYEAEERGRAEAEHWRQIAEQASRQAEEFRRQQHAASTPRLENYQDIEQFTAAMAQYQAQQIAEQRVMQERQLAAEWQQRQAQEAQRMQEEMAYTQALNSKLEEATKKYPDFMEVVTSPELPGLRGTAAFQAILESDKGAEVAYFLGKNPVRAHQIAALPPLAQVREIGRIEASLANGAVSQAPPPPASVNATSGTANKDSRNMTVDEYYRHITRGRK